MPSVTSVQIDGSGETEFHSIGAMHALAEHQQAPGQTLASPVLTNRRQQDINVRIGSIAVEIRPPAETRIAATPTPAPQTAVRAVPRTNVADAKPDRLRRYYLRV